MRKKKTAGGVGKGEGKCVAGRRAAGAACMQSSNVMEDISCRTADPEELIYPRQTEIKLFVRKDIIDILKGSEHKTAAPPSPSLARAIEERNRFTRYSNESIYRLFFFSEINFSLFFLQPASILYNVAAFSVVTGRPTFLAYLSVLISNIKK